jgi:hypothetical protein
VRDYPDAAIEIVEEDGEPAIYVVFEGLRIARRGHPSSPQVGTWVSIEPGYKVEDRDGDVRSGELIITCPGDTIVSALH